MVLDAPAQHMHTHGVDLYTCPSWGLSPGFEKCPAVRINEDRSIQHTEHGAHTRSHTRADAAMNKNK